MSVVVGATKLQRGRDKGAPNKERHQENTRGGQSTLEPRKVLRAPTSNSSGGDYGKREKKMKT